MPRPILSEIWHRDGLSSPHPFAIESIGYVDVSMVNFHNSIRQDLGISVTSSLTRSLLRAGNACNLPWHHVGAVLHHSDSITRLSIAIQALFSLRFPRLLLNMYHCRTDLSEGCVTTLSLDAEQPTMRLSPLLSGGWETTDHFHHAAFSTLSVQSRNFHDPGMY